MLESLKKSINRIKIKQIFPQVLFNNYENYYFDWFFENNFLKDVDIKKLKVNELVS